MTTPNSDVLIIGGGVIGLSLAWELAQHGQTVRVVDRGEMGRESSWAGAGMLPPGPSESHWANATPLERLTGLSNQLHPQWSERFQAETGIDNEFRCCGTLRLADTQADIDLIEGQVARWRELGVECQAVDAAQLIHLEPELAVDRFPTGYFIAGETQIRNPRQVRALVAVCQRAGVALRPGTEVHGLEVDRRRIVAATTGDGRLSAGQYCLTAGCWTGQLAAQLGLDLPVKPIRGQIVLLRGEEPLLSRNVYVGFKYLTPRLDGRVLVGSTMEDAGFVKENTPETTAELLRFAKQLAPALAELPVEMCWSGLRPGTADGQPYLGRVPNLENAWVAAGHFRAGLHLSPATAVVMRALILGQNPAIDVSSLGVER